MQPSHCGVKAPDWELEIARYTQHLTLFNNSEVVILSSIYRWELGGRSVK